MAKFYQDITENGGTIRTHELREPRAYYGINKSIKSGNVIRLNNETISRNGTVFQFHDGLFRHFFVDVTVVAEGAGVLDMAGDFRFLRFRDIPSKNEVLAAILLNTSLETLVYSVDEFRCCYFNSH